MLYDQAQLLSTYASAYKITKDEYFADIMRDIVKYVERDLQHNEGGFYSAEDADSLPTFSATKKLGTMSPICYKLFSSPVVNLLSRRSILCLGEVRTEGYPR